jgi:hypothetical protein
VKPRVGTVKLARFQKMVGKSAACMPNHVVRVAPYWSTEVAGIQRPLLPASLGPRSASVGNWPKLSPPCGARPTIHWLLPHAWFVPPLEPG